MKEIITELKWKVHDLIFFVGLMEFAIEEFEDKILEEKLGKLIYETGVHLKEINEKYDELKGD